MVVMIRILVVIDMVDVDGHTTIRCLAADSLTDGRDVAACSDDTKGRHLRDIDEVTPRVGCY